MDAAQQLKLLSEQCCESFSDHEIDRALQAAVQGYLLAKATSKRDYALLFLGFCRRASAELFEMHSARKSDATPIENICSFCQNQKLRLVRGVDVAICSDCIDTAKAALQNN